MTRRRRQRDGWGPGVDRDRAKVSYRVKQRLAGQKHVIEVGDVYVWHGGRVVKADADELADLEWEADRAREAVRH